MNKINNDKGYKMNNEFVCSKHNIGYIKSCPRCAFDKYEERNKLITDLANKIFDRNYEVSKKVENKKSTIDTFDFDVNDF